jgi:hypothetical protein
MVETDVCEMPGLLLCFFAKSVFPSHFRLCRQHIQLRNQGLDLRLCIYSGDSTESQWWRLVEQKCFMFDCLSFVNCDARSTC